MALGWRLRIECVLPGSSYVSGTPGTAAWQATRSRGPAENCRIRARRRPISECLQPLLSSDEIRHEQRRIEILAPRPASGWAETGAPYGFEVKAFIDGVMSAIVTPGPF